MIRLYNPFDVFIEDGIEYIVTIVENGYIKEKMPLRKFIEINYFIKDDNGDMVSLFDFINKLEDEFRVRHIRKDI